MKVDYDQVFADAPQMTQTALIDYLAAELPHDWADDYRAFCHHDPYLLRITLGRFEYIFDAAELGVQEGTIPAALVVEDRVVVVHGRSGVALGKRTDHLMRGRPLGPIDVMEEKSRSKFDKGHFIAHAIGGGLEINIFPQVRVLNQGRRGHGGFRVMERYCLEHWGTYCFVRPTYAGKSWHPERLEVGVLRRDGTLWLDTFANTGGRSELEAIEQLVGPAIENHLLSRAFH